MSQWAVDAAVPWVVVRDEDIDRGNEASSRSTCRLLVEEMSACLFLDQEHPRRRWARLHIRYDR